MNAAVLGGLVEQWVWRCQMIVTQYQLRQPIDLKAEVEKLVGQAETQARRLEAGGPVVPRQGREQARHLRRISPSCRSRSRPDKLTDPVLNSVGRAEALHALADAFGDRGGAAQPAAYHADGRGPKTKDG